MSDTRGSTILAERSRRRMSQDKLADKVGICKQTLTDIEYNRIGVDDETFERIIGTITAEGDTEAAA